MNIVFDSQIFTMQQYGGVSRYISSLAYQLNQIKGIKAKIIAPFYVNTYLERLPKEAVSGIKVPRIPKVGGAFHHSGLWLSRRAISKLSTQIVHETYYSSIPSAPKDIPKVITVHDMIHELLPEFFSLNDRTVKLKRDSILRADHVICVSENTRRDLLEMLPISPAKVSVVHHGFDSLTSIDRNPQFERTHVKVPYLLYVGHRDGYKNFAGLLRAYASSKWLMQNFCIICIGGNKFKEDELMLMRELGVVISRVIQKNVTDDDLVEFYKNAAAFIYPSLYEGFGIPPLEAMSLNCPVICSNTSSIPEVVGNAGEYFDPSSSDSICNAIETVLENGERRKYLVQKGIERSKVFSWEKCALETSDVYQSII